MTPEEKGRFCSVCSKTVIDFTKASDKEIIEHLKKDKNACGRFYKNQLSQDVVINKHNSNYWTIFTFSIVGLFGFGNHNVYSQVKQDTVQTEKNTDIKDQNNQPEYRKIKVNVYDELGEIAGAKVRIKGTNKKTITDIQGNFEIEVNGVKQTTVVERTDSLQTETFNGKTDTASVRWVNDCEFVLQKLHPKTHKPCKTLNA